jgi:hypothetical protein
MHACCVGTAQHDIIQQITPTLCDGYETAVGQPANRPFTFAKDAGSEMRQFICTRTPLLYLSEGYPKARHTLKLVLVVGLLQVRVTVLLLSLMHVKLSALSAEHCINVLCESRQHER